MNWEGLENTPAANSDLYILKANDSSFPGDPGFIQTAPPPLPMARLSVQSRTVLVCWQRAPADYALINSSNEAVAGPRAAATGQGLAYPELRSYEATDQSEPGPGSGSQSQMSCHPWSLPSISWSQYNWMSFSWHWIHIYQKSLKSMWLPNNSQAQLSPEPFSPKNLNPTLKTQNSYKVWVSLFSRG